MLKTIKFITLFRVMVCEVDLFIISEPAINVLSDVVDNKKHNEKMFYAKVRKCVKQNENVFFLHFSK